MACENYGNKLIEMLEDGRLSWEAVARECIQEMSEDAIEGMMCTCGWNDEVED